MTNKSIFKQITGILIPILVLAGAVILAMWFIKTKPAPKKQKNKTMASAVKTITASCGSHTLMVSAMGTVVPIEDITLQPEVTGLVIWKSPNLVPGGIIKAGETLLTIDPRNYETARKQYIASLEKAKVEYQIEMARSEVAAEEWRMMGVESLELKSNSKDPEEEHGDGETEKDKAGAFSRAKSLALREPQLRAAKIAVMAASNLLVKATIDVERTEITAPFNAVVITEFVDRGQLVTPQSRLAQLAGTDAFRIEASLPVRDLQWLKQPACNGNSGAAVTVLYDIGAASPSKFNGRLTRILSSLDNATKMVKVMVRVNDPLMLTQKNELPQRPCVVGEKDSTKNTPIANLPQTSLLAGAYVKVIIEGITLDNVIELPGTLIREGNKVWVMNPKSQLEIRDVDVIRRQDGKALVKSGISKGEKIIGSHISNPIPGMTLRKKGDKKKDEKLKKNQLKVGQASPKPGNQRGRANLSEGAGRRAKL